MAKLKLTAKQYNKIDSIINDLDDLQYQIEAAGEELNFGKKSYYVLTAKELNRLALCADKETMKLREFLRQECMDDNDPANA